MAETLWASDVWTWNGWQSTVPIHRAVSTGNTDTLLNGFIWYDDMEIRFAPVPEPATSLVIGMMGGLVLITCRRQRC